MLEGGGLPGRIGRRANVRAIPAASEHGEEDDPDVEAECEDEQVLGPVRRHRRIRTAVLGTL